MLSVMTFDGSTGVWGRRRRRRHFGRVAKTDLPTHAFSKMIVKDWATLLTSGSTPPESAIQSAVQRNRRCQGHSRPVMSFTWREAINLFFGAVLNNMNLLTTVSGFGETPEGLPTPTQHRTALRRVSCLALAPNLVSSVMGRVLRDPESPLRS